MLYDQGNTHGTFVNKRIVRPNAFTELQDGDMISFGESTRILLVKIDNGMEPEDDEEDD